MLQQRFQGFRDSLQKIVSSDGVDELDVRDAIESGLNALGQDDIDLKGFSSEQIWVLAKSAVDRQKKTIEKLKFQEVRKRKEKQEKVNRQVEKELEQEREDEVEDLEEQEEEYVKENSEQMDEEYEVYMEKIDNEGLDQEEFEEEGLSDEVVGLEDNDQEMEMPEIQDDQQESKMEEEDESQKDQMEVESEEETQNIFQTMSYGLNPQNIQRIEKKLVQPKEWFLKGEILGKNREKEQLVDQKVDFDLGMKSTLQITEEINQSYEDILRQIILDKTFDDRVKVPTRNPKQNQLKQDLPDLDFEKNKLSLAQMEEQKYIKQNRLDNKSKSKTEIMIEQIKELYKQFCFEIENMSRVDLKVKKVIGEKVGDKMDDWLKEDKVPVTIQTFGNQLNQDDKFKPQDQELFTKTDMNQKEKKSLQRKIKKIKKIKAWKKEQKELEKTGLSKADSQLLKKNQSLVDKKLKDSKRAVPGLQKQSQFFKTLANREKS